MRRWLVHEVYKKLAESRRYDYGQEESSSAYAQDPEMIEIASQYPSLVLAYFTDGTDCLLRHVDAMSAEQLNQRLKDGELLISQFVEDQESEDEPPKKRGRKPKVKASEEVDGDGEGGVEKKVEKSEKKIIEDKKVKIEPKIFETDSEDADDDLILSILES